MSRPRRIIPVSSGKGGVGKTTFALNYALELSRHGRTVLVDLDTGTSSVRTCIDVPVTRDLYHFFKKGFSLTDCVTALDTRVDPRGQYGNFGFVAGPRHLIEDITNFDRNRRGQLVEAINALPADFVVLDLKAGLDENVIAFLPVSNSGILVFTPHLPAATLAASDIVKAILFRKLRGQFAPDAPVYAELPGIGPDFVLGLLERVEDVYDESVSNLDGFVDDLRHALGDHPVVRAVAEAVDSFVVHYVLNMFDGVQGSYETAVRPFVQNLEAHVSAHLTLFNLGWVVSHEDFAKAAQARLPALLYREGRAPKTLPALATRTPADALDKLASEFLGARAPARRSTRAAAAFASALGATRALGTTPVPKASRYLEGQLDTLVRMYDGLKGAGYPDNFRYLVSRSLHILSSRRIQDFGDTRIYKSDDITQAFRQP
jgi:MinD-like ATPase involved in chromosome partitioning or flagellar assembly